MADKYTIDFAKTGYDSYLELPDNVLKVAMKLQREIQEDPRRYPKRMTRIGQSEEIYLYQHPDPNLQITYGIDEEKKRVIFYHFKVAAFSIKETLFISYSHEDEKWLIKIKKFLSNLEQQGVVKVLDDSQLQPGDEWRPQINDLLESARAAMLLVSEDFLNSRFIRESELPALLEAAQNDGKKIFWMHIRPSTVFDSYPAITKFQSPQKNPQTPLAKLSEVEQEEVLVEMSKRLRAVIGVH